MHFDDVFLGTEYDGKKGDTWAIVITADSLKKPCMLQIKKLKKGFRISQDKNTIAFRLVKQPQTSTDHLLLKSDLTAC